MSLHSENMALTLDANMKGVARLRRRFATDILLLDALKDYGAKIRFTGGTHTFQLCSVKASCTAGGLNLVSAWERAARKRLADLQGRA